MAHGTLLNVMRQPGWEGGLGENGFVYVDGWVPSLFTWNYHDIVNWLYANATQKVQRNVWRARTLNTTENQNCWSVYPSVTPSKPSALFTRLLHSALPRPGATLSRGSFSSLRFLHTDEQAACVRPLSLPFSHMVDAHSHFLLFYSTVSAGHHPILRSLWSKHPSPPFHFSCTNYLLEKLAVCPVEFLTGRPGLCMLHPCVMAEPVLSLYFLPLVIASRSLIRGDCRFSGKRLGVKRRPWQSRGGLCEAPNVCPTGGL